MGWFEKLLRDGRPGWREVLTARRAEEFGRSDEGAQSYQCPLVTCGNTELIGSPQGGTYVCPRCTHIWRITQGGTGVRVMGEVVSGG
jgi:hypothetical protein